MTSDKELKYHLFGTRYRFLEYGDEYTVPNTKASITIDASYRGSGIGYNESIKMYLTFSENDSLEVVIKWLYDKIQQRANSVIVESIVCKIDYDDIIKAIQNKTMMRIGAGM